MDKNRFNASQVVSGVLALMWASVLVGCGSGDSAQAADAPEAEQVLVIDVGSAVGNRLRKDCSERSPISTGDYSCMAGTYDGMGAVDSSVSCSTTVTAEGRVSYRHGETVVPPFKLAQASHNYAVEGESWRVSFTGFSTRDTQEPLKQSFVLDYSSASEGKYLYIIQKNADPGYAPLLDAVCKVTLSN